MRWLADVQVVPREDIADPAGLAITDGLRQLGHASVQAVHVGKLLQVEFEAPDESAAERMVGAMCRQLLANPVIEDASWEIRAAGGPRR